MGPRTLQSRLGGRGGSAVVVFVLAFVAVSADTTRDDSPQPRAALAQAPVLGHSEPGLGDSEFMAPIGTGWGESRPVTLNNGGVPSGHVWKLRWRGWGDRVAHGRGMTWIFRPGVGYLAEPGRMHLRASRLGTCPGASERLVYTRLDVRVQRRPGGHFGRWHRWGGHATLCGRS